MTLPAPLLFFIFAATAGTTARSCNKPPKTAIQTTQTPASTSPQAPQVAAVQMSRGACYGRCPVYDIYLSNNGLVRYTGRRFVEKEGVYEKTFDNATVNTLLREFSGARVDTMHAQYDRPVSDLPSINFTITFANGQTKEIQNAHFGPQILPSLAQRIDELVQTPDYSWKRTATKVEE